MKELINLRLPRKMAAFVPLRYVLQQAITSRFAFMMNMSGYPAPSSSVGRIINMIDLSSVRAMLTSILRLRDLARFAHDIIQTNVLMRVDKNPLDRTEIVSYINLQLTTSELQLSELDIDFVSYLIISSDAVESTWILNFDDSQVENRILRFHQLYKSMDFDKIPSLADSGDVNADGSLAQLYVYEPGGEIQSVIESSRIKTWVNEEVKPALGRAETAEGKKEVIRHYNAQLVDMVTIYHCSILRMIDHMFCALMDVGIWRKFVTPRTKVDANANIERGKGLRLMSTYFHSILMYPHIFNVELFMGTYHKLQNWINVYPILPEHIIKRYELEVKRYDVLNASGDVALILNALDDPNNPTGSNVIGLPSEVQYMLNMDSIREQVTAKASGVITPIYIEKFKDLSKPEYKYYMLSHPIAEFDAVPRLLDAISSRNVVTHEIETAANGIVPGINRYYPEEMLTRLNAISPRIPFGYSASVPSIETVEGTTSAVLEGGSLKYRALAPRHTYDYQWYIRNDKYLTVFKASDVFVNKDSRGFKPVCLLNRDAAGHLRNAIRQNFKSLYPVQMHYGDYTYTHGHFTTGNPMADETALKNLFETLFGMNWTIIKAEIGSEYIKRTFATFISSFALLYVSPEELASKTKGGKQNISALLDPHLVQSYGLPYGVSTANLAARQKPAQDTDFIKLTDQVYIRFLTNIPLPTDSLVASKDFYGRQPYYFYTGNSDQLEDVTLWVIGDGLLHHALAPLRTESITKAPALMTPRHAHLNDRLLFQPDLNYSISSTATADTGFSIPLAQTSWSYDIWEANVKYVHFSGYSKGEVAGSVETTEVNKLVTEIEQSLKQTEAESTIANMDKASTTLAPDVNTKPVSGEGESSSSGSKKKKDKFKGKKEEDKTEGDADLAPVE